MHTKSKRIALPQAVFPDQPGEQFELRVLPQGRCLEQFQEQFRVGRIVGERAQGRRAGLRAHRPPRGVVGVLQRPRRIVFGQPFRRLSQRGEARRADPSRTAGPSNCRRTARIAWNPCRLRRYGCARRRPPGRSGWWPAGLPGRLERRSGPPGHTRNPPRFRAARARRRWPKWRLWTRKMCSPGAGNPENALPSTKFFAGRRGELGGCRSPNNPAVSVLKVPVPITWA